MGRLIINNRSTLSDIEALELVRRVMAAGRISNDGKQYCYLTCTHVDGVQYDIATDLRKGSDSFTVYYSPYNDKNFPPKSN